MRRIGTTLATLALVGTAVLTGSPAQAATSSTDASLALSCPSSGALCIYDNTGFTSILDVFNGSESLAGQYSNERTSSVRNRSSCSYLLYRNADRSDTPVRMGPRTEISNLSTFWGSQWNNSISYVQIYC